MNWCKVARVQIVNVLIFFALYRMEGSTALWTALGWYGALALFLIACGVSALREKRSERRKVTPEPEFMPYGYERFM